MLEVKRLKPLCNGGCVFFLQAMGFQESRFQDGFLFLVSFLEGKFQDGQRQRNEITGDEKGDKGSVEGLEKQVKRIMETRMVKPMRLEIRLKNVRPAHSLKEKPRCVFRAIIFFQGRNRVERSGENEKK